MKKKLYRTRKKVIYGVCGGLANHLDIDVSIVRVIALLMFFGGGIGFLPYIIAAIVIPLEPKMTAKSVYYEDTSNQDEYETVDW